MKPQIQWRGLRSRIIAWMFFPTLAILVAVALVTFTAYQRVTEDLVVERDMEVTRLSAGQLSTELENYSEILTSTARNNMISQSNKLLQAAGLNQNRNRLVVFDGGVVILDHFGVVTNSIPEVADLVGQNWSDQPFFQQLIRDPGPTYSNILPSGPEGEPVVAIAVPIYGYREEILGSLVGMFRIGKTSVSALYGGIVKQRIGESGKIYIVDGTGQVIYHDDQEYIGDDFSGQDVIQRVLLGAAGAFRTTSFDGDDIVAAYSPIPGTPWGVVTEERWVSLISTSKSYQQFLFVLLVLGVAIPVVVVVIGLHRIMQPIDDLTSAAREIARGNFDQRIEAHTDDEIEELAIQFNKMASNLQESYAQLEQRVEDRTRELVSLYEADEKLLRHLDLNQLLNALVDIAVDLLHADKSSLMVWNPYTQRLNVGAARGFMPETLPKIDFAAGEGIVGKVFSEARPAIVEDTHKNKEINIDITEPEGIRSLMHLPIQINEQVFGVFNLSYLSPRSFSQDEQRLFQALTQRAALAIENAQLYAQAQQVATLEERQRLARELHDAVTQTLFSASLIAEVLPVLWDRKPDDARIRLTELRQLTRGALAEMRTLLMELRPTSLTEADVSELFRHLKDAFIGRARVQADLEIEGLCQLEPEIKVALYRIAQEALNNIHKHAEASYVSIVVRCLDDRVELIVEDNGCGFDPDQIPLNHFGLGIMRERAQQIGAEFLMKTEIGQGTRIEVKARQPVQIV